MKGMDDLKAGKKKKKQRKKEGRLGNKRIRVARACYKWFVIRH